jgi:glutamyl-Q tRNA(Asp) synthetase
MITRFAPSPTGPLHLGHAYSAMVAHDMAVASNGTFLLRIEDIDQSRARIAWETQIYDDLHWLGLRWPEPVMQQNNRLKAYRNCLDRLWSRSLLYPCVCNRRDIMTAASAPQEGAPMVGPDGMVYPGTCRPAQSTSRSGRSPTGSTLRLDIATAVLNCGGYGNDDKWTLNYSNDDGLEKPKIITFNPTSLSDTAGDVVLARKDMQTSYHLSVVVDDAAQGITDVVRGADLLAATPVHVLLQSLLGLPTPRYHHHRLIRDEAGKRLAKRDDSLALSKYRQEGATPNDIRRLVGHPQV